MGEMTDIEQKATDIIFYIRRYVPEKDSKPFWQEFTVHVEPGMTVLDGLHQIKQTQDPSLCIRYSCRMGVCGSCAMLINGTPTLACNTQILHLTKSRLTLASLPNFEIIKDLVPDLTSLFSKHRDVMPYILREDKEEMLNPSGELYQHPDELLNYLQFTYCIKCGCCMAACPTLATDPDYLGPQAIPQAYRFSTDTRDGGFPLRKEIVGSAHGAFRCHYAGECSNVCPKGVDPARAIQLMKRQLVLEYFHMKRKQKPSGPLGKPEHAERKPEVPDAPPFTV
jgi:succinate dehydrogenase / fumarate reductase iron-sulfur subunit